MADVKTDDEEKEVAEEKEEEISPSDEEKGDEDTDDETEEKTEKEPKDVDVPTRDTNLQHIISRKNRKIKKLEEGKDEADDEEELAPEAATDVDKKIDERMKPFEEAAVNRETDSELSKLYSNEPEAKPYDKLIRKFIDFEQDGVKPYALVPPFVIYHHLAFGQAEAEGARAGRTADEEAKLSKTGGRAIRRKSKKTKSGLPSVDEMENMDEEEFNKKIISPTLQGT